MERVWIIGASSGIGEALAHRYALDGAGHLILSSRGTEKLEKVAADLAAYSGCLITVVAIDATQRDQVVRALREIEDTHGAVDTLIYSAGVGQRALASETCEDVERHLMELNYFGAITAAKAVLPSMTKRGVGKIVMISSVAGKIGTPLRSSYAASKHALHGYFDCLRAEVHDAGIRVILVSPGFIRTDITLRSLTGDGSAYGKIDDALVRGVPVGRCALLIKKGIDQGNPEFVVAGLREGVAVYLRRFFPKLLFRLARSARST